MMDFLQRLFRTELGQVLRSFKKEFIIVGLFSLVTNVLMLSPTLYMLQVFDRVIISQSELTLLTLTLVLLVLFVVMAISEWLRSRLLVRSGVRFDVMLNRRVFNAIYDEKLKNLRSNPIESFNDLNHIRQFLTGNGVFAFFDAPWTPIYILICYFLHPLLGITALIFGVLLFSLAWYSHKQIKKNSELVQSASMQENLLINSKVRNAEVVESMGMVNNLYRHWFGMHHSAVQAQDQSINHSHQLISMMKFLQQTQASLTLAVGAWLVVQDELRPSAMVAANLLVSKGLQPISLIVSSWQSFFMAKISFNRLSNLLKENPVFSSKVFSMPPSGAYQLINLSATVMGRKHPILNGINFQLKVGDVVAVMGPSGSGKSTLARCLLGIWPNTEGEVLLDGHRIQEYDRSLLGPHIGYLPQDIELFDGSIAENIARFTEVDSNKVIAAAQQVGIHDVILRMPMGYDTPIGIAGGRLSGGQRQRLALARALYGSPQILILDEPNANLDEIGELALMKTIQTLKREGKTIVLITHTPKLLSVVDSILLLKDGLAIAYGPKDLMLQKLNAQKVVPQSISELPEV